MIDFSLYVGKKVFVQLTPPNAWLVVQPVKGLLVPVSKNEQAIALPFVLGEIAKRDNAYVLKIDEPTGKLEVQINPATVLAVTEAIEERILRIAGA